MISVRCCSPTSRIVISMLALPRFHARVGLSRKLPRPSSLLLPPRPPGRLTLTSMAPNAWSPNRYPQSRRSDHVDVYQSKAKGAVTVPDPYSWLEQNSKETTRWVEEQEKFTREYIHSCPDRKRIEADIRIVTDYARVRFASSSPFTPSPVPRSILNHHHRSFPPLP